MPFTRQEALGSHSMSQSQLIDAGVKGNNNDGARNTSQMLTREQSTIEQAQEGRAHGNLTEQAALDMAGSRGSLMRQVHGVEEGAQREPAEDAYNRHARVQ